MWKPADDNFSLADLNNIAARIGRTPNHCNWHVAQEYGAGLVKGYRWTAVDAVVPVSEGSDADVFDTML
jgi:hypothetical protein